MLLACGRSVDSVSFRAVLEGREPTVVDAVGEKGRSMAKGVTSPSAVSDVHNNGTWSYVGFPDTPIMFHLPNLPIDNDEFPAHALEGPQAMIAVFKKILNRQSRRRDASHKASDHRVLVESIL